jgi:Na+/proline symporter
MAGILHRTAWYVSSIQFGFPTVLGLICLQVYLISSLIIFGIQAVALTDAKFPVWYPYYGTWVIGICVESTLLILPNVYSPPNVTFDYVVITVQCLRVVILVLLISLFFGLRNDKKEYDNADAEQQSLLKNKSAGKPGTSEDSAKGYGTTTGTTTSAISVAASEDSWVVKQQKAQELIQKRLQQDGNWFTYVKGFAVCARQIARQGNVGANMC